ncbi:syntaxin [Forsythia ovata]|uniref:Syntaxin n=1 Tax=Forsythia ovata TaxID=205694 RepID=A0ABD1XB10_9LAMI
MTPTPVIKKSNPPKKTWFLLSVAKEGWRDPKWADGFWPGTGLCSFHEFDQLRAMRFQDAINHVEPRKKLKATGTENVAVNSSSSNSDPREVKNSEVMERDEVRAEPIGVQQQLLDDETRSLQVELPSMLDVVQDTERKIEMSALNHLMSSQQIFEVAI